MNHMQLKYIPAFLAMMLLSVGAVMAAPTENDLERIIERAIDEFGMPGMAAAVVYGNQVYFAGGDGITQVNGDTAVDGQTLFRIGSVSKAFTAATLAILADEGKLGWDDAVIDHIPEFRMWDSWVTREFTIRDLLTHRSGLPLGAGDLLFFPDGNATRQDIINALRHLKPASSFRSQFDYDNLLYIVAGEVAERVSAMPFEDFLETRLLQPIGMDDCVASPSRAASGSVLATPHIEGDDGPGITGDGLSPATAAAGGITCSANSMAAWMNFVLNKGVTEDGTRIISEKQFNELLSPVTLVDPPGYMTEHAGAHLNAYALGWNVSSFYGQPSLAHAGAVWGSTSFILLLPEQELGVFAAANLLTAAPRAVGAEIADEFMRDIAGSEDRDWISIISDLVAARNAAGEAAVGQAEEARAADSTPSLPLENYTGSYRDPWYGQIHITLEEGTLWFRSDRNEPLSGPLEHFQYDTFIARWTNRQLMADAYVSFSISPEGDANAIRMKAVSPLTDFSFDFHDLDLRRVEQAE